MLDLIQISSNSTMKMVLSKLMSGCALGVNGFCYGFCAGEINFFIKERTEGEFAGFSQSNGILVGQHTQQFLLNKFATVNGNFYNILPCSRVRGGKIGYHSVIKNTCPQIGMLDYAEGSIAWLKVLTTGKKALNCYEALWT